jgi:hypothetical protein
LARSKGPWRGRCIQGNRPGKSRRGNFEAAIDPPRGFNARERRVVAMPSGGKNLREISATFSTSSGYTAADIVPAAKLKLHPALTLVEFPIE